MRSLSRVAEGLAQFLHCDVQTLIEVSVGRIGPEAAAKLISGHDLAWPLQKHEQYSERLGLDPNSRSVAAKLSTLGGRFERAEAEDFRDWSRCFDRRTSRELGAESTMRAGGQTYQVSIN